MSENDQLKGLIEPKKGWENIKFFRPKGCKMCNGEGYKGRLGIYEVLENSEEIEKMITQAASAEAIEKKAIDLGMLTMIEDGFIKAVQGITSIEEVMRVTKE
jgi:type II secretory ATPase GspE/PulE/Tfp pilus assembly ATPase PilB-like protein